MIYYNERYEKEIRDLIEANPRNYIKILKSTGIKRGSLDRTYLIDYIYSCTPMLDDKIHSLKTRIYWALHHMTELPECLNDKHGTHKLAIQNIKSMKHGYPMFCNINCQHESTAYYDMLKNAMIAKHGVENAFQIPEVKRQLAKRKEEIQAKRDATYATHFGNIPGRNLTKSLATRRERYGNAFNLAAVSKTKLAKYGDANWNNSEKNFQTKKLNGTMNSSKPEEASYELLVEKFGKNDIIRQFKSEKYPFACDFYIKSHDIYIECNYGWTHGTHPFDKSNADDVAALEMWKSKKSKYYDNAADTWTRRDVMKKHCAEENGLKHFALYSFDDFCIWLEMSVF